MLSLVGSARGASEGGYGRGYGGECIFHFYFSSQSLLSVRACPFLAIWTWTNLGITSSWFSSPPLVFLVFLPRLFSSSFPSGYGGLEGKEWMDGCTMDGVQLLFVSPFLHSFIPSFPVPLLPSFPHFRVLSAALSPPDARRSCIMPVCHPSFVLPCLPPIVPSTLPLSAIHSLVHYARTAFETSSAHNLPLPSTVSSLH